MKRMQHYITPAMGKKLIAKGVCVLPDVKAALASGRVLVVAGTTNVYVARELLLAVNEDITALNAKGFCRGITLPRGAHIKTTDFIGDVLIENGHWVRGKDVFELAGDLKAGDVIFKGANAVNLTDREAGVLIGHPQCGTAIPTICAGVGRRVGLYIPVGLEKRVPERISVLARLVNSSSASGPRLLPLPGEIFTELDAIETLTGAKAHILSAGGICGAEGGCYLLCEGDEAQLSALGEIVKSLNEIPDYTY